MKKILIVLLLVVVVAVGAWLFTWWRSPKIGHVKDEAQLAGLTADYFNAADEKEYLRDMDRGPKGPIDLSPDEIKGRNTWVMWTAGNDRLWDKLTLASAGVLDFIKTLSSYPGLKASRDNRWTYLGLVNEPCFVKATGPDPKRYRPRSQEIRAMARSAAARLPPGPLRERAEISGREVWRPGEKHSLGFLLRIRHRNCRHAPVPEPRFR